jgi:L-asparaginase II
MRNPILIELTRGALVECLHAGAVAVARPDGALVLALGDTMRPVFPRSAIKPLQALSFVESGAVDRFGFGTAGIALACASHAGMPAHVAGVAAMLSGAGLPVTALACGVHEPMDAASQRELVRSGLAPSPLHHNCSGKHAGMLATATHLAEPVEGYWRPDHPVQERIRRRLEDLAGCPLGLDRCGIDGCSVPNWAMPLAGLAQAFARFATGESLGTERAGVCRRIVGACWAHPDLVAGPGWLVTEVMKRLGGRVLLKSGAEGVYCGALVEHGFGFALKIDDGARRAAEAVVARLLAHFYPEAEAFGPAARLTNWRGVEVGAVRSTAALEAALRRLP